MRIIWTVLINLALISSLASQVSIGNNTFPVLGDTLKYFIQNFPPNIEVSDPGPDQVWDFSSLSSAMQFQLVMHNPAESVGSADFPDADYYIVTDAPIALFGDSQTGDRFMKVKDNVVQELGFFSQTAFGIDLNTRYDTEGEYRRAPLNFGETHQANYSFSIPIATAELPDSIVDELPIIPDSFRLRSVAIRDEVVDSWGTLHLPSGSFEVLRMFRNDNITSFIDILLSPGVWQQIDKEILGDFADFLAPQDLRSYIFYSDVSKEEVAVMEVNSDDDVLSIQYKANAIHTNTYLVNPGERDIFVHPNPSYGDVRFELLNYPAGEYRIQVYNIVGKKLWSQNYKTFHSNNSIDADLSFLSKGTYLYSLIDKKGNKIITKRIMIIAP